MQKADHSGHRSRMKERYLKGGLDAFAPHEILELMLYYAIPYRNTNDIAKLLIQHFGSLSSVLEAPVDALTAAGLTQNQAIYLKLFSDVTRVYYSEKYESDDGPLDFDRLPGYIAPKFIGHDSQERVLLILADTKGKEVFCGFVADGSFEEMQISVRKIVRMAMNYGANYAIIAHNHPSGVALPSAQDLQATIVLRNALALVDVVLVDHYIVANNECISMVQSHLFD